MNLMRLLPSSAAVAAFLLAAADLTPLRAAPPIDLNNDQVPDIWALIYSSAALAPNADTDGDGQKNSAEAAAGTDPTSPTSVIAITSVTADVNGVHLVFPTKLGKRYQVQTATSPSATWTDLGSPIVPDGSGSATAHNTDVGATGLFYRVRVLDVDSDGDGVNDWEELQIGFDPQNSHSRGLGAPNDLSLISSSLTATNVISVNFTGVPIAEPAAANVSTDTGVFTITRSGNVNAVTVNFTITGTATNGSDYTISAPPSVTFPIGVNTATVSVTPLPDTNLESPETVLLNITPSPSYTVGTPAVGTVLIADYASANGNGALARYWNNTSTTIPVFSNTVATASVPIGPNPALTRIEPQINNAFGTSSPSSPGTQVNSDYFVGRYTADLLPEFSQVYTFTAVVDRGCRLTVNGQTIIDLWGNNPGGGISTVTGTTELQANQRVPIVFEYLARSGNAQNALRWQSANRSDEVIPQSRLFANAPPIILSATEALLLKGGPIYTYQIVASGEPTSFNAANLPPGWTVNTTTGVISGSPTIAGLWAITLTATNANGSGSAILNLEVNSTGAAITRDVWSGVPGTAVASIPLATAPTTSADIPTLEGPQNSADDYGSRIRGFITAPTTGTYKFFLTASDSAELWISNDDDPVNLFKRAEVTTATGYRDWTNVSAGKSPLLWLFAGKRYFVEVRHKAGVGADHVSVGWLKPGEGAPDQAATTTPSEVVPSYALSPYEAPAIVPGESTLFTATLSAVSGVTTNGFGSASLRLSADETQAIIYYSYSNLNTAATAREIRSAAHGNVVIFNLGAAAANPDGSFSWNLAPAGGLSSADIINVIKGGNAFINIGTTTSPGGEIKGTFGLTAASQTFTPPPPLTWSDSMNPGDPDSSQSEAGAARFLVQATFGVNGRDVDADGIADAIEEVNSLGFEGWIDDQFTRPASPLYPYVFNNRVQTDGGGGPTYPGTLLFRSWWQQAVTAPDQLRQRMAFALSEIVVTSEDGPLDDRADALSSYYDMLLANAFGNFYDVLEDVTLHPAMGRYLDMLNNRKPNLTTGRIPNENYAREILQLFSIGLNRMHPDGSLILNSKGEVIPTYDQDAIVGYAHVFTGWTYNYTSVLNGQEPATYRTSNTGTANWIAPMQPVPLEHFTGPKRLLNNVVLPGLATIGGQPLNPYASHSAAQYNTPAYQLLVRQELDAAHSQIFNHENTGPFICRQLIQRLVTGTPSRGYLYRVVQKFNNNGSGVRGDLKAVLKAILLDHEARSSTASSTQGFGKQREPIVRVTGIARGFAAPLPVSGTFEQGLNGDPLNLIRVDTSAPHLYTGTQTVHLEFPSGSPSAPVAGPYSSIVVTPTELTTRPVTTQTATYSQTNDLITVTIPDDHTYNVGNSLYIDFTSGTPSAPPDGFYTVVTDDPLDIFLVVRPLTAISGTYSQTDTTITVTATGHTLDVGNQVYLDFTSGTPSAHVDGAFTVVSTTPGVSFTVTSSESVARTGNVVATPGADAITRTGNAFTTRAENAVARSGTAQVTYSDWRMDETGSGALAQTPMRSPTVFNFFVPDYQFPGRLAQAGLITPEFEITSETTAVDQVNFLYQGIYNDFMGILGMSSFRNGGRAIVLDFRKWLGTGPGGLPWVDNANVPALVDKLSIQLMGHLLPSAVRTKVINQATSTSLPLTKAITAISTANPCQITVSGHGLTTGQQVTIAGVTGGSFTASINNTFTATVTGTNTFTVGVGRNAGGPTLNLGSATVTPNPAFQDLARNRMRAIIHLIVTSPQFTVQK